MIQNIYIYKETRKRDAKDFSYSFVQRNIMADQKTERLEIVIHFEFNQILSERKDLKKEQKL